MKRKSMRKGMLRAAVALSLLGGMAVYNGPPVKTTILNFLRAPWHVNLISKNVRSLPGLGLFSSPHTSGNKSRWFPLTYFQRCETMAAPQPLPYAAKMP